jgi:hypothetical protein
LLVDFKQCWRCNDWFTGFVHSPQFGPKFF